MSEQVSEEWRVEIWQPTEQGGARSQEALRADQSYLRPDT